nr:hypothetical protein [Streptomyces prunicolor]
MVRLGDDVRGVLLEQGQSRDAGRDGRDELDGRGAGADDGDGFSGQVVVVVPGRGVELLALEGVEAGDAGDERTVQEAGGGDEDVGDVDGSVLEGDGPGGRFLVELRGRHRGVEADVGRDAERVRGVPQVLVDLGLRCEASGPCGVLRERVRVQV